MHSPEKNEMLALYKQIEKETTAKLRDNRTPEFAVRLASHAQQKIDRVREEVVRKGAKFDCQKGCSYCCSYRVGAFPQETFRIARELKQRAEFTALVKSLSAHVLENHDRMDKPQRKPCPFLVANACSIYTVRPMMCRKCNSLDVEKCKLPDARIPENPEMAAKSGVIVSATVKAYERNKLSAQPHELVQGVLLALTDPTAEKRWYQGDPVFEPYHNKIPGLPDALQHVPGH